MTTLCSCVVLLSMFELANSQYGTHGPAAPGDGTVPLTELTDPLLKYRALCPLVLGTSTEEQRSTATRQWSETQAMFETRMALKAIECQEVGFQCSWR